MVLCFRCCLIWAIKKSFRWSKVSSVSLQVGSHPRGGRFFCREDVHELCNFFFNSRKKSLERVIREGTFCVINALRSFLPNLNLCNYVFFLLLYFFFFFWEGPAFVLDPLLVVLFYENPMRLDYPNFLHKIWILIVRNQMINWNLKWQPVLGSS